MNKALLGKKSLLLVFGNLKFHGNIDDKTSEELAMALNNWVDFADLEPTPELEKQLQDILFPEFKAIISHNEVVKEVVKLANHDDFCLIQGRMYYKEIGVSIPLKLAELFQELINDGNFAELNRWINFWKWLSLHKSEDVRKDLYSYVLDKKLPVLPSGLLLKYRRIKSVSGQVKEEIDFQNWIIETYLKVRKSKKSTSIPVYEKNGKYNLRFGNIKGVLKELYTRQIIQSNVKYTDNYSQTLDYRVGIENRMPMSQVCKDKSVQAGPGFHSGGKGFGFDGFGDVPCLVIVNPMDVGCIFTNDYGKSRECAFTIVAILKNDLDWIADQKLLDAIEENTEFHVNRVNQLIKDADFTDINPQPALKLKEFKDTSNLSTYFTISQILK